MKFSEFNSLYEASRAEGDVKYTEVKVKGEIARVVAELSGNRSGAFTRLGNRYKKLSDAIEKLSEQRNKLNDEIKGRVEELFDATDVVYTRVVETVSVTATLSKASKGESKEVVNYEKIAEELAKLIPEELQSKVEELTRMYTTMKEGSTRAPALRVTVNEGVFDTLVSKLKGWFGSIIKWASSYDKKLAAIKSQLA